MVSMRRFAENMRLKKSGNLEKTPTNGKEKGNACARARKEHKPYKLRKNHLPKRKKECKIVYII